MPVLHSYRHPFSLEHVTALFSKLLSPLPVLFATLATVKRLNDKHQRPPTYHEVKSAAPWLIRIAALVCAKVVSRELARIVTNNGWKRDRPVWDKEVVVVTGGVGGIGREIVNMLLKGYPGAKIAILDLAEPDIEFRGLNVQYYKVNLCNYSEVVAAANTIRSTLGHPTMIVNNAGIMRAKSLLELSPKEFDLTLKVNVLGAYHVVREFLPYLIKMNHGHIVTIASTASFITPEGMADYSASKAGVLALHEAIGAECAGRYGAPKVRTTAICPVKVRTLLGSIVSDHKDKILAPVQEPWQIAERVVLALDSGISGGTVFAPSFLWAILPMVRVLPAWFNWYVCASSGTKSFATKESREKGLKSGYKILVDEEE